MNSLVFFTLGFICCFFFLCDRAEARFEFLEQIPNGHRMYSLNLSNCQAIGHLRQNLDDPSSWCEPGNGLNQFGRDFLEAGLHWTKTLCEKDSDGDGLSNGVELGDPCCLWSPGTVPFRLEPLSLPNDPLSTVPIQFDIIDCRTDIILGPEPTVNAGDSLSSSVQSPQSILHSPSPVATAQLPTPTSTATEPQSEEEEKIEEQVVETTQTASTFRSIETHASLGYAGFMLLLPLGFLSSRYLQPVIGETWWLYASLIFQVGGFSCALSSLIVLGKHTSEFGKGPLATSHNVVGFVSICLVFLQLVNSSLQLWKNSYGWIFVSLSPFVAILVLCTGLVDSFLGIELLLDAQEAVQSIQRTKYIFLTWIITQLLLLPLAELCFVLWKIAGGDKLQKVDNEDTIGSKGLYRRAENEYFCLSNNEDNHSALHVLEDDSENEEFSTSSRVMQTNSNSRGKRNGIGNHHSDKSNVANVDWQSSDSAVITMNQLESLWIWLKRLPWIFGIIAALCTVIFGSIEIHLMSHVE